MRRVGVTVAVLLVALAGLAAADRLDLEKARLERNKQVENLYPSISHSPKSPNKKKNDPGQMEDNSQIGQDFIKHLGSGVTRAGDSLFFEYPRRQGIQPSAAAVDCRQMIFHRREVFPTEGKPWKKPRSIKPGSLPSPPGGQPTEDKPYKEHARTG
jgi:hypothetical protein